MTDHEVKLTRTVLQHSELLFHLTRMTVNVIERAVELGAFSERATVLLSDCEQLLAAVQEEAEKQKDLHVLFGLPPPRPLCPA
jgi:hypothetical protein